MFRTPYLPEFLISMGDFGMLKAMYRGRKGVRHRERDEWQ